MERNIIQITAAGDRIYALCDDGTLWSKNLTGAWSPVERIPQYKLTKPTIKSTANLEEGRM